MHVSAHDALAIRSVPVVFDDNDATAFWAVLRRSRLESRHQLPSFLRFRTRLGGRCPQITQKGTVAPRIVLTVRSTLLHFRHSFGRVRPISEFPPRWSPARFVFGPCRTAVRVPRKGRYLTRIKRVSSTGKNPGQCQGGHPDGRRRGWRLKHGLPPLFLTYSVARFHRGCRQMATTPIGGEGLVCLMSSGLLLMREAIGVISRRRNGTSVEAVRSDVISG